LKTQVAIIGAGPSGLILARLLSLQGIPSVIIERQSREYVEARIRAGILEQTTVELLREAQVVDNLDEHGIIHGGFSLAFNGRQERIDMNKLTGKNVTVYGQTELTKDLYDVVLADDSITVIFKAENVEPVNYLEGHKPQVKFKHKDQSTTLDCDFIAGCDGYHGPSRANVPSSMIKNFERVYPFGWLGILSETPPVDEELIYANHERGFALCSMRSLTRSRYYIQVSSDEKVENWSDDAFWDELRKRLPEKNAQALVTGASIEKSIAATRSFVAEPMRFGNLFLAGDAAHIVPPTGAKGLNQAAADINYLSKAFIKFYKSGSTDLLDKYSEVALKRVWASVRFSWWFTSLTHNFNDDPIERKIQLSELDYIFSSTAGQKVVAENYVGLPFENFE